MMCPSGLVRGGAGLPPRPARRRFLSEEGELHGPAQGPVPQTQHGPPHLPHLPPGMLRGPGDCTSDGTDTGSGEARRSGGGQRSTGLCVFPAQIQPMDTTLLAAARSRTDAYHSVVSTSPVLYLTHPSTQPMRRPLALTLPCPPDLEKQEGGQDEPPEARPHRDRPAVQRRRVKTSPIRVQGSYCTTN